MYCLLKIGALYCPIKETLKQIRLRTAPSYVSIPPLTQNSTMAKDELLRQENVQKKYSLLNDVAGQCSSSGCVNRRRLLTGQWNVERRRSSDNTRTAVTKPRCLILTVVDNKNQKQATYNSHKSLFM